MMAAVAALVLAPHPAPAYFEWEPVTDEDWSVAPDPDAGVEDAAIIFRKVFIDHTEILKDWARAEVYARVRILGPEARGYGDFTQFELEDFRITRVAGRTLLPDGTVIELDEEEVHETEVARTADTRVGRKAFSLKGVTDDCIVEAIVRYVQTDAFGGFWLVQQEAPVLAGECVWRIIGAHGSGMTSTTLREIAREWSPAYLWLHMQPRVEFSRRPEHGPARELVFTFQDLPAFSVEPYSLPIGALGAQLHCYYAKKDFWREEAEERARRVDQFCSKDKDLRRQALAGMDAGQPLDDRITAAYRWVHDRMERVVDEDWDDDNDDDRAKTADQALDRGEATPETINRMFCALLRRLEVPARMVYVVDRDEGLLVEDAHYWQFDTSLVVVDREDGRRFYAPGERFLAPGLVPWRTEGVRAFVVDEDIDKESMFVDVPFAPPTSSRTRRVADLSLDSDLALVGEVTEHLSGHTARRWRLHLADLEASGQEERLTPHLAAVMAGADIDSARAEAVEELEAPLVLRGAVRVPEAAQALGDRVLLDPLGWTEELDNPFTAEERTHPVVFNHAFEVLDAMTIQLGEDWTIEGLPEPVSFANEVGRLEARVMAIGGGLTAQVQFRLHHPFWPASAYGKVRELFQARAGLKQMTVVLAPEEVAESR